MKKAAPFLLRKYTEMSGDKKVRISLDFSKLVHKIHKEGEIVTKTYHGNRPSRTS